VLHVLLIFVTLHVGIYSSNIVITVPGLGVLVVTSLVLLGSAVVVVAAEADALALVAIPVTSLGEGLVAEGAFERHVLFVDSHVVTEVAEFGELHRALFALEYLVQSLGLGVHSMDEIVLALVLDLLAGLPEEVLSYVLRIVRVGVAQSKAGMRGKATAAADCERRMVFFYAFAPLTHL